MEKFPRRRKQCKYQCNKLILKYWGFFLSFPLVPCALSSSWSTRETLVTESINSRKEEEKIEFVAVLCLDGFLKSILGS
jgi:hypothetical protein